MDLPAAISLLATKVDAALSVEDGSIALSPIATKFRRSVVESNNLGLAPNALATISEGHASP